MTWSKLSDDFCDDCETLDDDAFRLHVEGLNWSNRKLLDCLIPKEHVRRFATHPEAVHKLLEVGWWKDVGDYYEIVHHAVYQRSRASVLAQQATNRKNGKLGGRPSGPPRERPPRKRPNGTPENPDGLANGLANRITENVSNPQVVTQTGNRLANPEGQARRSSRGNHKKETYEGPCQKDCGALALGSEAKLPDENPAWCGGCNFVNLDRLRRNREESAS